MHVFGHAPFDPPLSHCSNTPKLFGVCIALSPQYVPQLGWHVTPHIVSIVKHELYGPNVPSALQLAVCVPAHPLPAMHPCDCCIDVPTHGCPLYDHDPDWHVAVCIPHALHNVVGADPGHKQSLSGGVVAVHPVHVTTPVL